MNTLVCNIYETYMLVIECYLFTGHYSDHSELKLVDLSVSFHQISNVKLT